MKQHTCMLMDRLPPPEKNPVCNPVHVEISVSQLLLQTWNGEGSLGRQLDLETYLVDVSINPLRIRSSKEDWSTQSKRRQDKFQDQVVYQENLHHFNLVHACKWIFTPYAYTQNQYHTQWLPQCYIHVLPVVHVPVGHLCVADSGFSTSSLCHFSSLLCVSLLSPVH